MNAMDALFESNVPGLELLGRGKVRDIYAVDKDHLLIVTSDRLSAYDVVMPSPIPGKGHVLTQISLFWFDMMSDLVDNQLTELDVNDVVANPQIAETLLGRALVVKRLEPLPIEAVVRGYLIGSGWRDYCDAGSNRPAAWPRAGIETAGGDVHARPQGRGG
jgi:phosphoribosylaminoimidazole-succinocarboxamide synthase